MALGAGRTLNRFFIANVPLLVGQVAQIDTLAPQLLAVLRLTSGDRIVLLDGSGHEYEAEIQALSRHHATALVLSAQACAAEPTAQVTLYQCSLKHEKFEWVLQKGTELGVSCFVPVISERSIVRPAEAVQRKYDRWRAIIREAAEQCGRGRLPCLVDPVDWPAAVASMTGLGFLPWEGTSGADSLGSSIARTHAPIHPLTLSLLIGPEGGITADEAHQAGEHGWRLVNLGPRTLRAETAAIAAVTIALDYGGELSTRQ